MSDEALELEGHCYCGTVRYRVRIPAGERPLFTAYCHCDSCRRAHAAPLYQIAVVDSTMFEITAGADAVREYRNPDAPVARSFCTRCGSKVCNNFPRWRPGGKVPVGFFPATLDEAAQHPLPSLLAPQKNNQPEECILHPESLRWFFEEHLAPG